MYLDDVLADALVVMMGTMMVEWWADVLGMMSVAVME